MRAHTQFLKDRRTLRHLPFRKSGSSCSSKKFYTLTSPVWATLKRFRTVKTNFYCENFYCTVGRHSITDLFSVFFLVSTGAVWRVVVVVWVQQAHGNKLCDACKLSREHHHKTKKEKSNANTRYLFTIFNWLNLKIDKSAIYGISCNSYEPNQILPTQRIDWTTKNALNAIPTKERERGMKLSKFMPRNEFRHDNNESFSRALIVYIKCKPANACCICNRVADGGGGGGG